MRARTPVLLLLLLLSAGLAGCTGPPDTTTPTREPTRITDPDDYSYLQGNDTGAHLHDYWNGLDALPVVAELDDGFTTINRWGATEPIRPLEDMVFPQGTGRVTMTVTWDLDETRSRHEAVELWVKTAADHTPLFLAEVDNGDTLEMTVNNTQNDVPHQVLSNWYFILRYQRVATEPLMDIRGTHRVEATAHRTLDIPVFPGHPDHWRGERSLIILEDDDAVMGSAHHPQQGGLCVSGCFDTHVPANGSIVPPETQMVEIAVEHDAHGGQPVYLGYHGSNTWRFQIIDPAETDGGRLVYRIPIDDTRPDGPYSKQSQWAFELYTSDQGDPAMRPYAGGYTITLTAHRATS